MGRRWGKEDDAKLSSLFATARNSVNPKDLSVAAVKAVHNKFFPEKDYRNFAPLYRAKARAFQVGKTLEGHRQRKSIPSLSSCLYSYSPFCFDSQEVARQKLLFAKT